MNRRWLAKKCQWSLRTFGTGKRSEGVLKHIEKEIEEVRENPTDVVEWIDIVLLALDGAFRSGHTPKEICTALIEKQRKNTKRKWKIPAPNEPSLHEKEKHEQA